MNRTTYQVWRYNPIKQEWFRYQHIPECNTPEVCQDLVLQHKAGTYKGKQYKHWMVESKFKVVKVDATFTDIVHL